MARCTDFQQRRVVFRTLDEQYLSGWLQFKIPRPGNEVERGALVDNSGGPDVAPMALDDPLHGRQADAGAGKLASRVEPLEDAE
jgi:hypothetical protein